MHRPRQDPPADAGNSGWTHGGTDRARNLVQAWRERRLAAESCRQLIALHERVATAHPGLSGLALYREIVAARRGPATADAVLRGAAEAYAIWPVCRALSFRDVVHYLAVAEIGDPRDGIPGALANVRSVVEAFIPRHL
jgi:hypothetical protein